MRRHPGGWMQLPVDHRILEALAHSGMELTPTVIARNIDYTRRYVNTRLGELVEKGFVERAERGWYAITDDGIAYLNGEIDASDISD